MLRTRLTGLRKTTSPTTAPRASRPGPGEGVRIGDIVLRNRVVTSSSLLGYGVANSPLVPYGMSPVSLFVPLSEFGAVTTRTSWPREASQAAISPVNLPIPVGSGAWFRP